MNVSITPELEAWINQKVKTGMYHSVSEVVREGLRLLKEQDELKALRFKELKRSIHEGISDQEAGRVSALDTSAIKVQGKKRLAAKRKAA